MKMWLHITSGRGPAECAWVSYKITDLILQEAVTAGVLATLVNIIEGPKPHSLLSSLISLEGEKSINFASSWLGTIQWSGQSPYRPDHKRKNWFTGVYQVSLPEKENKLLEQDCEIKSLRASGPGGQYVNKTESAIQVTHLPTGLSVKAQEERSQYLNKKLALARLAALLKEKEIFEQKKAEKERWITHLDIERGNALRIYKGEKFIRLK